MTRWIQLVALLLSLMAGAFAALNASRPDEFRWLDLNGTPREPFSVPDANASVLLFIQHDCPISNRYAPEINRIEEEYSPKRIAFTLVYEDAELPAADARKHAREYAYRIPALLDPKHRLAKQAGAKITPEAVVFVPPGKPVYRGRIDDLYADLAHTRLRPTTRDLRKALTAILEGRPVPNPSTQAVGCFIPSNE
jgi:hypothetical protein